MEPASIRYKNPGAMWGNALAIKWGASKKAVTLNDGKGQGNNIAVFPTYVQGICAQLDLWRTSKNYRNKRFCDAIAIWSGHNSVESYIAFVLKRVPGMDRNTVMDDAFWRSAMAIGFLKAQAGHEAGKVYPAPDGDWIEAQKRVLSGVPTANTIKKAAVSVTTGVVPSVTAGTQGGLSFLTALLIGLGIALAVFLVWKFKPGTSAEAKAAVETPHPALIEPSAENPDRSPTTTVPADNAGSEQPK
jgi:hypothetical protein